LKRENTEYSRQKTESKSKTEKRITKTPQWNIKTTAFHGAGERTKARKKEVPKNGKPSNE
jgi:hypothetical protein